MFCEGRKCESVEVGQFQILINNDLFVSFRILLQKKQSLGYIDSSEGKFYCRGFPTLTTLPYTLSEVQLWISELTHTYTITVLALPGDVTDFLSCVSLATGDRLIQNNILSL